MLNLQECLFHPVIFRVFLKRFQREKSHLVQQAVKNVFDSLWAPNVLLFTTRELLLTGFSAELRHLDFFILIETINLERNYDHRTFEAENSRNFWWEDEMLRKTLKPIMSTMTPSRWFAPNGTRLSISLPYLWKSDFSQLLTYFPCEGWRCWNQLDFYFGSFPCFGPKSSKFSRSAVWCQHCSGRQKQCLARSILTASFQRARTSVVFCPVLVFTILVDLLGPESASSYS